MVPELMHAECIEGYEASRRRLSRVRVLVVAALVTAIALLEAAFGFLRPGVALPCGAVLSAVVYVASVRGQDAWRGARAGLVAGVLPLLAALTSESLGLVCTPAGCSSLCVPACAVSGSLAAVWIALRGHANGARGEYFAAAGLAATAVGALGCACVSYTGAGALALAMVLALGTGAALAPRAHPGL